MKLNNDSLKLVFHYIENQLNDEHGEYDTNTNLITAVKSAINHIQESDLGLDMALDHKLNKWGF
jgi:hypothetical protein